MAFPALSSVTAGGRNAASFTAGVTFGVAVTLAVVAVKLGPSEIDAVTNSINHLTAAVVAAVAALVPVYTIVKSWRSASPEQQQAAVAARDDRMVVTIDPSNATEAAMRVASLPEVKTVITTQAVAAATPAVDKIVGPDAKPVAPEPPAQGNP